MKKFKVYVQQEYTLWANTEYIVRAKSKEKIEEAMLKGCLERTYKPISVTSDLDNYKGLNLSGNGYEMLNDIEEIDEEDEEDE